MRALIQKEFDKAASIQRMFFPADSTAIQDSPKLALVVADPDHEWSGSGRVREELAEWTKQRGNSPRLDPGFLVWAVKKPGSELRAKVELWLAWKRVATEVAEGTLGGDFDPADRAEIKTKVTDAEEAARDEVWGDYRYVVLADNKKEDGLTVIDLGAGHSSSSESLCGRIITALKSGAMLNESVGSGYLDRNWPPAFKESGAWPLTSLRHSFLNGALTRLVDPDAVLRTKIVEFVSTGDFGLASGQNSDGSYERIWFEEAVRTDEVTFESDVFLVSKVRARALVTEPPKKTSTATETDPGPSTETVPDPDPAPGPEATPLRRTIRIHGVVPPELWNRLGTTLLPKLRSGEDLKVEIDMRANIDTSTAESLLSDLRQILQDLDLTDRIHLDDL
jgi:hypothetical protein